MQPSAHLLRLLRQRGIQLLIDVHRIGARPEFHLHRFGLFLLILEGHFFHRGWILCSWYACDGTALAPRWRPELTVIFRLETDNFDIALGE